MTQKIQGKFYPLKHEEWLKACKELTPAERDTLYYIRTLDPHNNGIAVSAAAIARDLSVPERMVHRQTISRALKRLDELGFIDLEILKARVSVKPKGIWCDEIPRCNDTPAVRGNTTGCDETPQGVIRHHRVYGDTTQAPETAPQKEYNASKTYIDYLEYTDRGERAKGFEDGKQTSVEAPSEGILGKYEERLKLHGIYRLKWTEEGLVENPKLKPILRALSEIPPDRAERAFAAFLGWAKDAT